MRIMSANVSERVRACTTYVVISHFIHIIKLLWCLNMKHIVTLCKCDDDYVDILYTFFIWCYGIYMNMTIVYIILCVYLCLTAWIVVTLKRTEYGRAFSVSILLYLVYVCVSCFFSSQAPSNSDSFFFYHNYVCKPCTPSVIRKKTKI